MANQIQKSDFVEVIYIGKLKDGTIFDTNSEDLAKAHKIFSPKQKYSPVTVCVGEHQILEGIDQSLVGKEVGKKYTVEIPAELGFGKRDVKKIQLVPMSTFQEHKVKPFPGLQVDFDGQIGIVQRVSGGRVMVNFNHPLAGKELVYDVEILQKITKVEDQARAFVSHIMPIKQEHLDIKVDKDKLTLSLPFEAPESFREALKEKLTTVLDGIKDVAFDKKEVDFSKMQEEAGHVHGPNCNH